LVSGSGAFSGAPGYRSRSWSVRKSYAPFRACLDSKGQPVLARGSQYLSVDSDGRRLAWIRIVPPVVARFGFARIPIAKPGAKPLALYASNVGNRRLYLDLGGQEADLVSVWVARGLVRFKIVRPRRKASDIAGASCCGCLMIVQQSASTEPDR
jgi:hypothetical protein